MSASVAPPRLGFIHCFAPGAAEENPSKDVLGGKGYSLVAMTRAGLPVPPGFVIETRCCAEYYQAGRAWPAGLEAEIRKALAWLEATTGRTLGRGPRPLAVAVRSGAAVSMPGMMDTVLNVGLRPELADCYADRERFWRDLRDYVRSYGETVCGIDPRAFQGIDTPGGSAEEQARRALAAFRDAAGRPFPDDPWEMLAAAVSAVFESWMSPRAVTYRERHDIRGLAGTAVTIMAMFPSERSGILFTQDPNRPEDGRIVIEASPGLGEAIVRGHVEPDAFQVDRASLRILERRVRTGEAPCVTDAEVVELARLGLRVEEYFGAPVDVEWGLAEGRAVLLQGRPIRGLEILQALPEVRREEIRRFAERAAGRPRAAWAIHNLAETLPAPTPLTWDIVGRGFMGNGFLRLYEDLGFAPSARVKREGFLDLVGGRIYADLERAAELFFGRFPMEYDVDGAARSAEVLAGRPTKFNIERAGAGFLLRLPGYVFLMIRAGRLLRRAARWGLSDLESRVLPAFQAYVVRARERRLETLTVGELLGEVAERERALNDFGAEFLKPGFLAGYYHGRLSGTLELVLGPEEGRALAARLLSGLEGDTTVESNIALYRVARGERTLEDFLKEYGHRAVNELELAEPRWAEDPSYPCRRIEQYRRAAGPSPAELHERRKRERLEAEGTLGELLRRHGAGSLEEEVRADLAGAQRHIPWRERCKDAFVRAVALVREALEALAERWELGRDLYFLERGELERFPRERKALEEAIRARKLRWQALQRLPMPEVLRASDPEAIGREAPAAAGDGVFEGLGVAAGVGTGTARVLRSPEEAGDLTSGYVLVCPTTDPSWTPLFVHAAGLVVERGGMLSHGAIVARDFGIPAVVLPQATRLLPDGAAVRIDGGRGRVEILKGGRP
jgi:pyruvate,water dikinase